jgi:hypothetical protein
MKTETTPASSFDTTALSGPTLLTDDDIAAVGGGNAGLALGLVICVAVALYLYMRAQ